MQFYPPAYRICIKKLLPWRSSPDVSPGFGILGQSGKAGRAIGRRSIVDTMAQGRSFKMRSQIGPKIEQDGLSTGCVVYFLCNCINSKRNLRFFGPPGEISGLESYLYLITYMSRLDFKEMCIGNGPGPLVDAARVTTVQVRKPLGAPYPPYNDW